MSGFFEIGVVRSSLVSKRHEKAITGREASSGPIGVKNRQPIGTSRVLVGRGKCVRQVLLRVLPNYAEGGLLMRDAPTALGGAMEPVSAPQHSAARYAGPFFC
jgi:hypothetical protein